MIKCYEVSAYITRMKQVFNDGCVRMKPSDIRTILDIIDAVRRCGGTDNPGTGELPEDIVLYTPQEREEYEKEIARINIDAISSDEALALIRRYAPEIINQFDFELESNKQNSLTSDGTGTKYPTVDAVNEVITEVRSEIQNTNSDKNFVYTQIYPSRVWEFNHPLNKMPSPTILDTANTVMLAQVTINDGLRIRIEFNYPVNGKVILN